MLDAMAVCWMMSSAIASAMEASRSRFWKLRNASSKAVRWIVMPMAEEALTTRPNREAAVGRNRLLDRDRGG